MSTTLLLAIAAVVLSAVMTLAWLVQRRTGNAGWVDAVWSLATGLVGAGLALAPSAAASPAPRQMLVAALIAVWGLRLGLHLAARVAGGPEDARYAAFRVEWGAAYQGRMFTFLQIQAAAAWLLVLCVLLAARNPAPFPGWQDVAGLLVAAVALAGEAVADRQLRRFKRAGGGGICERGLWGWSRHPNYFFEWLHWLAYPLLAISPGFAWGAVSLIGPALMYWLLVHVSGIPPLERQMAARRGAAFASYQARVSAFFPRPPKRMPG